MARPTHAHHATANGIDLKRMKPLQRLFAPLLLTLFLAVGSIPVRAHANLAQSQPPANAALDESPTEIRLWFTEPLEPRFSRITLRDGSGDRVELPAAQVDVDDPKQLFVAVGDLAHDIYTITWRVVSAADGHSTEGSIPFAVGTAVAPAEQRILGETLPAESAGIRWFNLLSTTLLVGAVGFWVLAWRPLSTDEHPLVVQTLRRLMFLGWLLTALASALLLLHHTASVADVNLIAAVSDPALGAVLSQTRFGSLWLLRMVCWLGVGLLLLTRKDSDGAYMLVLALCGVMLLSQSLYSHASAAQDAFAAVAGDWLHLSATGLWVGGLTAFAFVLPHVRHAEEAARLVATFSNYVRVCVAALIISGVYAAWLHVGSVEGLFSTLYGRALLVKLVLFAPLLALAGVNLIFTARGLRNGQSVWVGWLRRFVAAEVALSIAILAAVGVMTATNPAREVLAVRSSTASSPTAAAEPFFEMQTTSDVMAHLEFTPGYAGENTFIITLFNMVDGSPIDDASLIRLRFDNQAAGYAQSELRPQPQGNGTYTVEGANLSAPGAWRVRMTIQRPGAFDTVLDFAPTVSAPPPPSAPILDTTIPATVRLIAILLVGLALIAGGAFFLVSAQPRFRSRSALLSLLLVCVGGIFLLSAAFTFA